MKKILFLSFFLLAASFLMAQNDGPTADYYDNGKLKFKGQYQNGAKVGEWKFYYESGKLKAEGLYIDGAKSGTWVTYHSNGMKKSKGNFKNNGSEAVKNGDWVFYHKNGVASDKGKYKMGRKVGLWYTYNKLEQEMSHKDYGR